MQGGSSPRAVTELRGTLDGLGLPAIVRFLSGLNKDGCLRIVRGDWQGEIGFVAGRLTSASFGSRQGLEALDALVQVLRGGTFNFDTSSCTEGTPSIELSPESLQAHLDELVARIASGNPSLPWVESVPQLVDSSSSSSSPTEEPLPLDRATLQTLLAVDGQRTVRDIVAQRGSFDALWQLGILIEVGLVRTPSVDSGNPRTADSVNKPADSWPSAAEVDPEHCPRLGFADDPRNSFARPTRLHRCFASGSPVPVSLDDQRALCLTDQYAACPRFGMVPQRAATRVPTAEHNAAAARNRTSLTATSPPPASEATAPTPPRASSQRGSRNGSAPVASAAPTSSAPYARWPSSAPATVPTTSPGSAATASRAAAGTAVASLSSYPAQPASRREIWRPFRIAIAPVPLIAGVSIVVLALALVGFVLVPQLGNLFAGDNADLSDLPNASAIAAGTSVAQIAALRTPVPGANVDRAAVTAASPVTVAQPTEAPQGSAPRTASTPSLKVSTTNSPPAAQAAADVQPPPRATLFDDRFASNAHNWLSNPQGTTWLAGGSYRLITRQPGEFVAVSLPIGNLPSDVLVSATFRKLGGTPPGGGFGIILRDQSPSKLDGISQSGQYYVLEVGDLGEVGIWRRDSDHWVDVLPWQRAEAVHTGVGANQLAVSAIGNRLSMSVNGTPVVTRIDSTLNAGGVGLMAGGDGNQVTVDSLTVQTP